MVGDESYAGSRNFYHFEARGARDLRLPRTSSRRTRAAWPRTCCSRPSSSPGDVVPNNIHFDTTRANVEHQGAEALDLVIDEGLDPAARAPVQGQHRPGQARPRCSRERGAASVPLVMLTVTNNSGGGQPVSMANMRAVREVCRAPRRAAVLRRLPLRRELLVHPAARAGLREPARSREIAREMFALGDGCTMSAKKDGLVNIGGFLALNNAEWAEQHHEPADPGRGLPDLRRARRAAISKRWRIGLREVLDEDYLDVPHRPGARISASCSIDAGVPIVKPVGRPRGLHRRAALPAAHAAVAVSRGRRSWWRSIASSASARSRSAA